MAIWTKVLVYKHNDYRSIRILIFAIIVNTIVCIILRNIYVTYYSETINLTKIIYLNKLVRHGSFSIFPIIKFYDYSRGVFNLWQAGTLMLRALILRSSFLKICSKINFSRYTVSATVIAIQFLLP